jgi:hypothetical protein
MVLCSCIAVSTVLILFVGFTVCWFYRDSNIYSPVLGPAIRKAVEKYGMDIILGTSTMWFESLRLLCPVLPGHFLNSHSPNVEMQMGKSLRGIIVSRRRYLLEAIGLLRNSAKNT